MAAKPADRIGYIKCPGCGFADADVNVSAKTNCAYHSCPKCKDFSRGTADRDKVLRATMHTKRKGEAPPKRDRGRPRKPKSKTKTPKEPVVDDNDNDDDDDNDNDDGQGDFWKFW